MLAYLLKVTVIWVIFLLLFEGLYKKSRWFNANRIFLVFTFITGIVLPLVRWHFPSPITQPAVINNWNVLTHISRPAGTIQEVSTQSIDWKFVLFWVYTAGLIVLLTINIREVAGIIRRAVYGNYETWNGHKIFTCNKSHPPYSFMSWIFIYRPEQYTVQELEYMIRHEEAHVANKHWMDLLLLQFFCMVFWFHPLVWRYRYLLKLTHEYQADNAAAEENNYDYGHFLLQQTLLKGAPSMAHSFHFSPLKNRINMLTQIKTMRSGWKYAAVIPALFCCTFLMAQSRQPDARIKKGNRTTYRGNTFEWGSETVDTVPVLDPVSGEEMVHVFRHSPGIVKMNQEKVFHESEVSISAQYRADNIDFSSYFMQALKSRSELIPDSVAQIQIRNVVIGREGKIVYYDILYLNAKMNRFNAMGFSHSLALDPVIEEIVDKSAPWNPALENGAPVNVFIETAGVAALKSLSLRVKKVETNSVNHTYEIK